MLCSDIAIDYPLVATRRRASSAGVAPARRRRCADEEAGDAPESEQTEKKAIGRKGDSSNALNMRVMGISILCTAFCV